ncbi:hypothetical protein GCM10029992_63020 [Glycomyces albus]
MADVVDQAAKDGLTWGITGMFFAEGYNQQVADLKELMKFGKETVNLLADNLQSAAEDWGSAEEEISQIFNGIELVIVEVPDPGC